MIFSLCVAKIKARIYSGLDMSALDRYNLSYHTKTISGASWLIISWPPVLVKRQAGREVIFMAEKARFWTAVCYPENMVEGWEQKIDDILEFPFAYCKHTMDRDSKSEHRKDHVHIMVAWGNTTTDKAALKLFRGLSAPGRNCCPKVEPIHDVRRMYDYLIHDTDSCVKLGKEKYKPEERIAGNNFDIGLFEQISSEDKSEALKEICELIVDRKIYNVADVFIIVSQCDDYKDAKYWEAFKSYAGVIDKICKGVYQKYEAIKEKQG